MFTQGIEQSCTHIEREILDVAIDFQPDVDWFARISRRALGACFAVTARAMTGTAADEAVVMRNFLRLGVKEARSFDMIVSACM